MNFRDRDTKITVMVDDRAGKGLVAEHGLSLWIDAGGKRILFDTGQGKALFENARRLKVPLEKTEFLVLSHGHYDHTGGTAMVLKIAPRARLVLHPGTAIPRYGVSPGKPSRAIGMPRSAQLAVERTREAMIKLAVRPLRLARGVGVTGPIPRETAFEDVGGPFFLDQRGKRNDLIEDDQALWVATPEGLIVCVGCSHAGLINTLHYARRVSGISGVRAVIGGFHLGQADENRIERTIAALRRLNPAALIPCHCTGKRALRALADAFGTRSFMGQAGMRFPHDLSGSPDHSEGSSRSRAGAAPRLVSIRNTCRRRDRHSRANSR